MDRGVIGRRGLRRAAAVGMLPAVACCMAAAAAQGPLADPTRPPSFAGQGGALERPWDLTSTVVSPRRRVAVINGQVVGEGDRIDGMTVVKIGDDRVVLRGPAGKEVIPLLEHRVKKPAGRGGK